MLKRLLSSLSICRHREITFPQGRAPLCKVACLECGKVFDYDWDAMKIVKDRRRRQGGIRSAAMNVLTKEEMLAKIDNFVCECGYKPDDKSRVYTKEGNTVRFTCPKCGATWEATRATIN